MTTNLGPLCIFHHAIKTAGLWQAHQPTPGDFRWRSPLGHVYTTRGEPVCPPLPDSLPEPERIWLPPATPSPLQRDLDDLPLYRPTEPEPDIAEPPTTTTTDRAPPEDPPF